MKLRFTDSIAGRACFFLAGSVIDPPSLDDNEELRAFLAAGLLEHVQAEALDPSSSAPAAPLSPPPAAAPAPLTRKARRAAAAEAFEREALDQQLKAYRPVPALWPDGVAVVIGGGPSLTAEDVAACRGRVRVVAVNDAYRLAPWADVLYACDPEWWGWHRERLAGAIDRRYSLDGLRWKDPKIEAMRAELGVTLLGLTGVAGFELDPRAVRTGKNSGYQAINVAYHFGIRRVILLGFDCGPKGDREHWFGDHPNRSRGLYGQFADHFRKLAGLAPALGLEIVNASRESALDCFPRVSIEEALEGAPALGGA
jgi:hypothetical protein